MVNGRNWGQIDKQQLEPSLITATRKTSKGEYHKIQHEVAGNIEDGEGKSKSSAFKIGGNIKPDFLRSGGEKNKKTK